MTFTLTPDERSALEDYHRQGSESEARRAQIVLLSAEDQPASAIADVVGLSVSQVRYWRRGWQEEGLAIFASAPTSSKAHGAVSEATVESVADEVITGQLGADGRGEGVIPVPGVNVPRLALALRKTPGVLADDAMAEAGRKALLFHFERMLQHEPGSRLGADIEAVHDMRVATRRMRSAMELFEPFFKGKAIKPFKKELRRAGRKLGAVRDLEVQIANAQAFMADYPNTDLSPLLERWQKPLVKARRDLIRYLDKGKFERFVDEFHAFLTTPGAGSQPPPPVENPQAYLVRHVAPRIIYERYELVRAYEPVLDQAPLGTLHMLRIDFKRLRYALEFFEEVLGPEAGMVIKEIKGMQDHLGDLNDARVAGEMLRHLIERDRRRYSGVPTFMRPDLTGIAAYARAQEQQLERLAETFPQAWDKFNREEVRRSLALALAAL